MPEDAVAQEESATCIVPMRRKRRSGKRAVYCATAQQYFPCGASTESFCMQLSPYDISDMHEKNDLKEVMEIEMSVFDDPWSPLAFISDLQYNPRAIYLVARNAENKLVGYMGLWNLYDKGCATITKIAVHPKNRRCGVGKALMKEAFARVQASGCEIMQLEVRQSNNSARNFYRCLGFEEVSARQEYYDDPVEDGIVMAYNLDNIFQEKG